MRRAGWRTGPLVALVTCTLLFAADRALLVHLGVPPWEADPVLPFRHRPHAVAAWGGGSRINSFGFYDDEFSEQKRAGEIRGIAIGDSVIMGNGVTIAEALPNRLEARLGARDGDAGRYQIINAGVQGYWTAQYAEVLRRGLRFAPDFVVLGFCMNDVMTFYGLDPAHGGTGLDYHGIAVLPHPWLSYLVNETGIGRLAVTSRRRKAKRQWAKRRETYSVQRVAAADRADAELAVAWERTLRELDAFYDLAAAHGLPVLVLIFPYDFQLGHDELQEPQRIVARHAETHGARVFDTTPLIEEAVGRGLVVREVLGDGVHFTALGHDLVAAAALDRLDVDSLHPGALSVERSRGAQ